MELLNGRPTDTQGRMDKEIRVYDFLDSLGVVYQRIDHEAAMTICFYATDRRHSFIY